LVVVQGTEVVDCDIDADTEADELSEELADELAKLAGEESAIEVVVLVDETSELGAELELALSSAAELLAVDVSPGTTLTVATMPSGGPLKVTSGALVPGARSAGSVQTVFPSLQYG
jgi:hypothetical protein